MRPWKRQRCLIVNADDFGQSHGVNRGIIEAHERGIVTSASLMVRWPAAREAAAYGRRHPELSVGIHFDFCEWTYREGKWFPLYQVVPERDREGVLRESSRQLAAFRRLMGRDPTHIDSHQHAHRQRSVRAVFEEMASRLGVCLRSCTPRVRYVGGFYGQTDNGRSLPSLIGAKALIQILTELRPGFTELGCHPGQADDLDSMYRKERSTEVRTLCHPGVRAALGEMEIQLCSFHDLNHRRGNHGQ